MSRKLNIAGVDVDVDDAAAYSEMAKVALETATSLIAQQARAFAPMTAGLTGPEALTAFADAIMGTNAKVWPKGKVRS